jgi:hypothetical protein
MFDSSREVRGQSLSHRGLFSGITKLIGKIFKPKAKPVEPVPVKVNPETAPAPVKENLDTAPPPPPVKEKSETAPAPAPAPVKENQANLPSQPAPGVPAPDIPGVPPNKSKLKSYAMDFGVGTAATVAGTAALGYMANSGVPGQGVDNSTYPTDAIYPDNSTYPIDSANPNNYGDENIYDNSNNPVNPHPANPSYYANPNKNANSNYYANPTYTTYPNSNYQRRALVHGLRAGLFSEFPPRVTVYRRRC